MISKTPSIDIRSVNSLMRVYSEARRFLAYRERAKTLMDVPPGDLADAIDRDFIVFDLTRAERRLREALRAAEGAVEASGLPIPDEED